MKKLRTLLRIVALLALIVVCFPTRVAAAGNIYVPTPAYPSIQSGIDAAIYGDTVHVAAGTYHDYITLKDGVKVLGAGADVTTIKGNVLAYSIGSGTKLDGFTITNSNGFGMESWDSSPTVTNCTFSGNNGDGMDNYYGSPTVTNCTFSGNHGNGMQSTYSSPTVTNCTFSGNYYDGMYSDIGSLTVTNCTFSGNKGLGMDNEEFSSAATGISAAIASGPLVTNCTFSGNGGGGMFNYRSDMTVTNCIFSDNHGQGVIYSFASEPRVTNCTFSGNSVGMHNTLFSPTVTNCTFSSNGIGIYNEGSGSPKVTNCILWDGGNEIYKENWSTPVVTYCDIQGGYSGTGNINADPLFVNPATRDFHLKPGSPCIDKGSNLAPGLPDKDFEGQARIMDGDGDGMANVDMGADEFPPFLHAKDYRWSQVHKPPYSWSPPKTLNSWNQVRFENTGPGNVFGVKATITWTPPNVTIVDGVVSLGDIAVGGSAWSTDDYALATDMSKPSDPKLGIMWKIEYDDVSGVHHVINNVPQ